MSTPTPELNIIYMDEWLVALHKPANLLVHRNVHAPHEACVLQTLRNQLGRHVFPVHRLDRPTSGLLVMALSSEAARRMAQQFAAHTVDKTYLAVVRGFVPENGVIDSTLRAQSGTEQSARTDYVRLGTLILPVVMDPHAAQRYSLVRVTPKHWTHPPNPPPLCTCPPSDHR